MTEANPFRQYRPLRSGIAIANPRAGVFGTLGCVATSNGADRWLVSCYHVLCRRLDSLEQPKLGELVYQPDIGAGREVAMLTDRFDRSLDCAAALLMPGVAANDEILGIGRIAGAGIPTKDMRVIKSGVATGVTEGVIAADPTDGVFRIVPLVGFPTDYDLTSESDSGSLWIDAQSRRAVGLHRAGNRSGLEHAEAVDIGVVLTALGLKLPD